MKDFLKIDNILLNGRYSTEMTYLPVIFSVLNKNPGHPASILCVFVRDYFFSKTRFQKIIILFHTDRSRAAITCCKTVRVEHEKNVWSTFVSVEIVKDQNSSARNPDRPSY